LNYGFFYHRIDNVFHIFSGKVFYRFSDTVKGFSFPVGFLSIKSFFMQSPSYPAVYPVRDFELVNRFLQFKFKAVPGGGYRGKTAFPLAFGFRRRPA